MHQIFDRLFRTFTAKANPIGFGAVDFLELGLAAFLALLAWTSRPWIEPWAARAAKRTAWCMLALAVLPVALRLAILAHHPVPTPDSGDEFANLLVADTLRNGRLSNPAHALPQFFEAPPRVAIGPGAVLALGRALFGSPWAGVLLEAGVFFALCYWMLRAWVPPVWALVGGVLAAIELGPLSSWMNTYAGAALTASAGCLVFGAVPRLRESRRIRDAVPLGLGLAIEAVAEPRDAIFLLASAAIFFVPGVRRLKPRWTAALAAIPLIALPFLSRASLTDLLYRVRYYRLFLLPPLYLALPFFLTALGEFRFVWVVLTLAAFALQNIAAVAGLLILVSVVGLRRMPREAAWIVLALCGAHFTLWYGVHVFDAAAVSRDLMAYETWDTINHDNPARRIQVSRELAAEPGKLLVFVRGRTAGDWVHNAADIDAARVVWARDLGAEQDKALIAYYPDRKVWVVQADAQAPVLTPYVQEAPKKKQVSPFEEVR